MNSEQMTSPHGAGVAESSSRTSDAAKPSGGTSRPAWPDRVSVVVIGGGIVGVCTALSLARWGVSVALLEKGRVAAEQSSRNWGWVRMQGRDRAEVPLMLESRRQWAGDRKSVV